ARGARPADGRSAVTTESSPSPRANDLFVVRPCDGLCASDRNASTRDLSRSLERTSTAGIVSNFRSVGREPVDSPPRTNNAMRPPWRHWRGGSMRIQYARSNVAGPLKILITAGLTTTLVGLVATPAGSAQQTGAIPQDPSRLLVVDCLLPGQVRK